jgi:hypothetical protein
VSSGCGPARSVLPRRPGVRELARKRRRSAVCCRRLGRAAASCSALVAPPVSPWARCCFRDPACCSAHVSWCLSRGYQVCALATKCCSSARSQRQDFAAACLPAVRCSACRINLSCAQLNKTPQSMTDVVKNSMGRPIKVTVYRCVRAEARLRTHPRSLTTAMCCSPVCLQSWLWDGRAQSDPAAVGRQRLAGLSFGGHCVKALILPTCLDCFFEHAGHEMNSAAQ